MMNLDFSARPRLHCRLRSSPLSHTCMETIPCYDVCGDGPLGGLSSHTWLEDVRRGSNAQADRLVMAGATGSSVRAWRGHVRLPGARTMVSRQVRRYRVITPNIPRPCRLGCSFTSCRPAESFRLSARIPRRRMLLMHSLGSQLEVCICEGTRLVTATLLLTDFVSHGKLQITGTI